MSLREAIVANALWGAVNEPQIHYTQAAGRMDGVHTPRHLPLYTDCSGFVTFCYSWAGAPDPNGRGYNGTGYTGTLLDHLEHIHRDDLQPADLVVFGPYPGDHVVIVVDEGADPLTVSHGQEKGPIKIRLSREVAAHRAPVFYLRGEGLDDAPPEEDDMAQVPQKEWDALQLRVAALQQSAARTDKALETLLGPDEDGTDERVALFDPKDGLYAKVTALDAKLEAILAKLA